jgi:hypothetical protein
LAAEFGAVALLYGGVEGVHVDVDDFLHGGEGNGAKVSPNS